MSRYKIKPASPEAIKTYPLASRKSKVDLSRFAHVFSPQKGFDSFLNSLPDCLAGKDFKTFVSLMKEARKKERAIVFALGAHVIKVGLNPVIIDLMEKTWVTALSMNGAGIIHDFEIAFSGKTSEDVESQIKNGRFGMARETGEMLNDAINVAENEEIGLGEAVGKMISASGFPYKNWSLLGRAYDLRIPVTVHVALGTDIIHFHPQVRGEAVGKASLRDFFLFCSIVEGLEGGGVFINIGSAVILPEVFLKALSLTRNRGKKLENFSAAIFDFIYHYRPYQNVVKRTLTGKGRGFYFIGHHEIMIPLLAASLKSATRKK